MHLAGLRQWAEQAAVLADPAGLGPAPDAAALHDAVAQMSVRLRRFMAMFDQTLEDQDAVEGLGQNGDWRASRMPCAASAGPDQHGICTETCCGGLMLRWRAHVLRAIDDSHERDAVLKRIGAHVGLVRELQAQLSRVPGGHV